MYDLLLPSGRKGVKGVLEIFKEQSQNQIFSIFASLQVGKYGEYHISFNKPLASKKRCPLISAAPLCIYIKISTSHLISATLINVVLIKIVTICY